MFGGRRTRSALGTSGSGLLLLLGLSACRDQSPLGANGDGAIAGKVVGTDSSAVQGAQVFLASGTTDIANTRTDSSGGFRFGDLNIGPYELKVLLPPGYDTTAQAGLLGVDSGKVVVRTDVAHCESRITIQLRPIRRTSVTVPPGGADTIVTASGTIVEVTPLVGDVPITVSLVESTSVALSSLGEGTRPVYLAVSAGGSPAIGGLHHIDRAPQASARIRLQQIVIGTANRFLFVFSGGTNAIPQFAFADAVISTYRDVRTGVSYVVATYSVDVAVGVVEAILALRKVDDSCSDEYRDFRWVDGAPDDRIPLILIHGWEKWKSKCEDFDNFFPEDESHFGPLISALHGTPAIRSRYQIFVLKYPTNVPVEDAARYLGQQISDLHHPPVIIGHSMGGLVARKLMADPPTGQPNWPPRAVITLGTPHEGSRLADLANSVNVTGSEVDAISRGCLSEYAQRLVASIVPNTLGAQDLQPRSTLITSLTRNLPSNGRVITFAGELPDWSLSNDQFLQVSGCALGFLTPGSNDGVVPVASAAPSWTSLQAVTPGVNHSELSSNEKVVGLLVNSLNAVSGTCGLTSQWIQEEVDDIAGFRIQSVWIGDLNDDQRNELLVATNTGATNTGLLLHYEHTGTGWVKDTIGSFPGREPFVRDIGDADNDGETEVLVDVLIQPVFGNHMAELRLYKYGNGSWPYQTLTQGAAGSYLGRIGDVDGDGTNEIVVTGYNLDSVLLLRSSPNGFVQSQIGASPDGSSPRSAFPAIGDAMNLGTPQVYVGTHTSGNIYVYRQNGAGWLRTVVEENTGNVAYPLVGDVDNRGTISLLVSKYGGTWGLQQYTNTGDSWSSTLVEPAEREVFRLADINADGGVEVVSVWGKTVYSHARSADGTWRSQDVKTVGFETYWFDVGDVLNNKCTSIVVGQRDGGKVALLRRN